MGFQFPQPSFNFEHPRRSLFIFLFLIAGLTAGVLLATSKSSFDPRKKASEPSGFSATVTVNGSVSKPVAAGIWGVNFGIGLDNPSGPENYLNQLNIPALRDQLQIKSIRYMGGCYGDLYNPNSQLIENQNVTVLHYQDGGQTITRYAPTIDRVIALANDIGASVTYQLNVETQGLSNPCGSTPIYPTGNREQQLIVDLNYILTHYSASIRRFELGNEPWGAWTPATYITKAISFATIIKNFDPAIQVGLVGYPTSGNNQDPGTIDQRDTDWTAAVQGALTQICNGVSCFDFVTDHPYLYHGYSNPAQWSISPPQAKPDGLSGTLPVNQFHFLGLLSADGTTGYTFSCPINYAKGGIWGYECTWWSNPLSLTDLRGTGTGSERYKGQSAFVYFDASGTQKLSQAILNDLGTTLWSRTCPVDNNSGVMWANCDPWTEYSLSNYINTQPGNQTFAAYSAVAYFNSSNQNQQLIRQSLVMKDTSRNGVWQRTCPAPNGVFNTNNCPWTFITPLGTDPNTIIDGFTSSRYFGLDDGGYGPQRQYIDEAIMSGNGQTLHFHTCEVAGESINCPALKSLNLANIRGQGNESYSEYSDFTYFTDNNSAQSFTYNFPGLSAYYTAKTAGQKIQTRLTDYSPRSLAITEWNQKCWGGNSFGKRNFSIGTVDQGFYTAEMLLQMADKGVLFSSFHDLSTPASPENNGCSLFRNQSNQSAELNTAGKAFALTSVIAGGTIYQTTPNGFFAGDAPIFSLPDNLRCNQAGCLKGGYDISKISSYAAYNSNQTKLYIFILNRDTQNQANLSLTLSNIPNLGALTHYKVKTLQGTSFTSYDFQETETIAAPRAGATITVPASSIARVELFNPQSLPTPSPTVPPTVTISPPPPTSPPSPTPPQGGGDSWKMFVTSLAYQGNMGGLQGADSLCQTRAQSAGLTGTFVAWLSSTTLNASSRVQPLVSKPYTSPNGTLIAQSFSDLFTMEAPGSNYLVNKPKYDESGNVVTGLVWTNTSPDGIKKSTQLIQTCNNWTSSQLVNTGFVGNSQFKNSFWTDKSSTQKPCNQPQHLYCLQKLSTPPPPFVSGNETQ